MAMEDSIEHLKADAQRTRSDRSVNIEGGWVLLTAGPCYMSVFSLDF